MKQYAHAQLFVLNWLKKTIINYNKQYYFHYQIACAWHKGDMATWPVFYPKIKMIEFYAFIFVGLGDFNLSIASILAKVEEEGGREEKWEHLTANLLLFYPPLPFFFALVLIFTRAKCGELFICTGMLAT